jgi:hypothetical protein
MMLKFIRPERTKHQGGGIVLLFESELPSTALKQLNPDLTAD